MWLESRRLLILGAVGLCALWLAYQSVERHVTRSCMLAEWPHLRTCESDRGESEVTALQARIARNPGDASAYVALASRLAASGAVPGVGMEGLLKSAAFVAPRDPVLLRARINWSLTQSRPVDAAQLLVDVLRQSPDPDAMRLLAQLAQRDDVSVILRQELARPNPIWFERLLEGFRSVGARTATAMPLVSEALNRGLLGAEAGQGLVRQLKNEGRWRDAHALWLRLWNHPLEAVFNGGFEQGFVADGFDWEAPEPAPSKSGVALRQPGMPGRGKVLQIDFSGRPVANPILRQHLILLTGRYRLSGAAMTQKIRSEGGLVWTLSCSSGGKEFARSEAIRDTVGQWQKFEHDFNVPFECDGGVALELRNASPVDAAGGVRGQAHFDAIRIEPVS